MDYVELAPGTVNVTATVEATPTSVVSGNPISLNGNTAIIIEFFAPFVQSGIAGQMIINIWDGATDIGRVAQIITPSSTFAVTVPLFARRKVTPTNGSHTFSIKAWQVSANGAIVSGAGGAAAYMPAYLRITRA